MNLKSIFMFFVLLLGASSHAMEQPYKEMLEIVTKSSDVTAGLRRQLLLLQSDVRKAAEFEAKLQTAKKKKDKHALKNLTDDYSKWLAKVQSNQELNFGQTPLHKAVILEDIQLLKDLIEQQGNVHSRDTSLNTPLHYAAIKGNPKVVELLLENDAKIATQNNFGDTPVHLLIQTLEKAITKTYNVFRIELLMEKFNTKRVNFKLKENKAKVLNAIYSLLKILAHADKDMLNIQDERGNTPLYNLVVTPELKEPNINVDILFNAMKKKKATLANRIIQLHKWQKRTLIDAIKRALQKGANPNTQNKEGFTSLHAAVLQQNPELANLLIEHGADPNIATFKPRTTKEIIEKKSHEKGKTPLDMVNELLKRAPKNENMLKIKDALKIASKKKPTSSDLASSKRVKDA